MAPKLNWTPKEIGKKVTHSRQILSTGPLPTKMADEMHWRLANFVNFNGGHNDQITVFVSWENNIRHAWFGQPGGILGKLSTAINGSMVAVRLWCDKGLHLVVADTEGRHMLVGQRRWSVQKSGRNGLVVSTEAYERGRGLLNRLGMLFAWRHQVGIWHIYLANIEDQLRTDFNTQGTIAPAMRRFVPTNPWRPVRPYPPKAGSC
jgi:hypothetical protein